MRRRCPGCPGWSLRGRVAAASMAASAEGTTSSAPPPPGPCECRQLLGLQDWGIAYASIRMRSSWGQGGKVAPDFELPTPPFRDSSIPARLVQSVRKSLPQSPVLETPSSCIVPQCAALTPAGRNTPYALSEMSKDGPPGGSSSVPPRGLPSFPLSQTRSGRALAARAECVTSVNARVLSICRGGTCRSPYRDANGRASLLLSGP